MLFDLCNPLWVYSGPYESITQSPNAVAQKTLKLWNLTTQDSHPLVGEFPLLQGMHKKLVYTTVQM